MPPSPVCFKPRSAVSELDSEDRLLRWQENGSRAAPARKLFRKAPETNVSALNAPPMQVGGHFVSLFALAGQTLISADSVLILSGALDPVSVPARSEKEQAGFRVFGSRASHAPSLP